MTQAKQCLLAVKTPSAYSNMLTGCECCGEFAGSHNLKHRAAVPTARAVTVHVLYHKISSMHLLYCRRVSSTMHARCISALPYCAKRFQLHVIDVALDSVHIHQAYMQVVFQVKYLPGQTEYSGG